ncbi:uncharacterized protein LOC113557948 [Rhopalosiphum maidis]|uniref:uncharacterized protein LOC113557948 n=1 Tax=Rhopalosiphum maidis TaxID=43146 RepID=UPI000F00DF9A|nr:uncharacterized protein LOC113557948 [Rhopalosiphum maidis]
MELTKENGLLNMTVLEHFTDMDLVHVHCKQEINLCGIPHIRSLGKLLVSNSEVLKNRPHRLYYALPRFTMVLPLDDNIAFDVFLDWFLYKNVNNVYAVVENLTTTDCKQVVTLYLKQIPRLDLDSANHSFKQTIAKPFSHRPMEPELHSPADGPPSSKQ